MRFLIPVLLTTVLLAACGGSDASSPSTSASPSATATRAPTPKSTPSPTASPAPTPPPTAPPTAAPSATLDLGGSQPRQGGFLVVRLRNAPAGLTDPIVEFNGATQVMLPGASDWYALVGLPTWFTVGDYTIDASAGGGQVAVGTFSVSDGGFTFEQLTVPPGPEGPLTDLQRINEEAARVEAILSGFTPQQLWSGPFIMPAQGAISEPFGVMRSVNGGAYYPHTGVDIANNEGTPVYAAANGIVAMADTLYLYGNTMIMDHGAGVFTLYGHMQGFVSTVGQQVKQGDLIGYMGQTGLATGPHVHWEVDVHGIRTDGTLWTQAAVQP